MSGPFEMEGNWYKGNLHTHTSNSDGEPSPEEVLEGYKEHNYDFLSITDHHKVTEVEEYSGKDFLLISGVEIGVGKSSLQRGYHLVAINVEKEIEVVLNPEVRRQLTVQKAIDFLKEKGCEVILGHPYWSGLTMAEVSSLEGQLGIEVYNRYCHRTRAKGLSSVYWDALLAKGKLDWGFAVDDTHFRRADAYRGWIMVKAPTLNKGSIISSIKEGLFYSSSGPKVKEVHLNRKKAKVYVHTSPVKTINFICDGAKGRSIWNEDGKEFFEAEFELKEEEKYLRIECIDKNGDTAWTNPLFLRD